MNYKIKPLTLEDFLDSMEGLDVKYGEPLELIWRLAQTTNQEIEWLYERIEDLERQLGL